MFSRSETRLRPARRVPCFAKFLAKAAAVAVDQRCSAGRFATHALRACLTRIAYGAAPRPAAIAAAAVVNFDKTGAPRPTGVPASPRVRFEVWMFPTWRFAPGLPVVIHGSLRSP